MRGESSGNMDRRGGISEATVRRLSNYFRILEDLEREGVETVSSDTLADRYGTTSAQVRKDFSSFGSFGRRGLGYQVRGLRDSIGQILGIDRGWRLVLVGAGNLGHALFHYEEFRRQNFTIVAIFDSNPDLAGSNWSGVPILPMEEMRRVVEERDAAIGVIAVPAAAGQDVADRLVAAGVKAILNFAPVKLKEPESVFIRNVNLSIALESLSYSLSKHSKLKPL
ncbi:MAG: redox-sensing transcriptional repressor Rex [Candidatus Krumholzibacteriia bacterium]